MGDDVAVSSRHHLPFSGHSAPLPCSHSALTAIARNFPNIAAVSWYNVEYMIAESPQSQKPCIKQEIWACKQEWEQDEHACLDSQSLLRQHFPITLLTHQHPGLLTCVHVQAVAVVQHKVGAAAVHPQLVICGRGQLQARVVCAGFSACTKNPTAGVHALRVAAGRGRWVVQCPVL